VIRGQSPLAVALAMYAPRPLAVSVDVPHVTTSETMLAFHAPPLAVMPPRHPRRENSRNDQPTPAIEADEPNVVGHLT
jgi:hypothetical protein